MKSVTDESILLGVLGSTPKKDEPMEEPKEVETEGKPTPAKKKKAVGSKPKQESKPKRDTRISIALTEDLAQAVKDEAWQQRTSVNSLLVEIIDSYIKKQQRKGR